MKSTATDKLLKPYLSPLAVWALAFGAAVGWGAFIMPGTTFLPIAGPIGTLAGIAIGALIMIVIGVNYQYMLDRHADAGGTFSFATNVLGHDHGFLCAWFLILVYLSIAWANATALPLIFRNLAGGLFQFGFHYHVYGFDVYFGEVALSLFVIVVFGTLCLKGGRLVGIVQTLLAIILACGVLIGIVFAISEHVLFHEGMLMSFDPAFSPANTPAVGILYIIALTPWAFVGFESITHSVEEYSFSVKKTLPIMVVAIIAAAVAYIGLAQIAIVDYHEGSSDWVSYIDGIGEKSGLEGIPVFYAVKQIMGDGGLAILLVTLLAAVFTGLLANFVAVSRLVYAMAKDRMLPSYFGQLSSDGVPRKAVLLIFLMSLPIPFFGRTVIGWIVDINTVCAAVAYAYTSICAFKVAKENKDTKIMLAGIIGTVVSVFFFLYFLVPNFASVSELSSASYLILVVWCFLGFAFFRYVFQKDERLNFGKSTVVWIMLLFMILFSATMWVRGVTYNTNREVLENLNAYNVAELAEHDVELDETAQLDAAYYLDRQLQKVNDSLLWSSTVQMLVVILALFILFNLYKVTMEREKRLEAEKAEALESSKAKSIFLSNMSHDIRTPMNAIIGYVHLAKEKDVAFDQVKEYLDKIDSSSQHLLALINDVLEMSRIESGRMELEENDMDICKMVDDIYDMFAAQMSSKKINFDVSCEDVETRIVKADKNRLNRVLLNLISNAFKFTSEEGSIRVTLRETGKDADGKAAFELRIKDDGIGMSEEFAEKIFEAFERERTSTVSGIQGTGLGMAITKSIVDLMGGTIEVLTKQGEGTEFVIRLSFVPGTAEEVTTDKSGHKKKKQIVDFTDLKVLLVEDIDINREMASFILKKSGFTVVPAVNGQEAVDKVKASEPGEYAFILMDIQMPVMNGYEATMAIRELEDEKLSSIPIIAMTANAFAEDVEKARQSGMNGHIAKPLDVNKMLATITEVLNENA